MNCNSANYLSYFDTREEDGEIRALFFLDKSQWDTEGRRRRDLRFLDLERSEITEVLSTIPPDVHFGFSMVPSGNQAYAIGGKIGGNKLLLCGTVGVRPRHLLHKAPQTLRDAAKQVIQ